MPNQAAKKAAVNKSLAKARATKVAKKAVAAAKVQKPTVKLVVRDAATGRYLVGGTDERQLVNKHAKVTVKSAPAQPKHFTQAEIKALTKLMKVA